ncbi:MAG TPA: ester cyclase [Candidatus Thermoplasmatota archaeon]|jgi:ketosteroid isomerase-like protein|nr:ester cyclase [Candidatus Thermoplasmatota archaeon]
MAMRASPERTAEENLRRMVELDDAWNAQDWEKVGRFHTEEVAVFWPGGAPPTRGRHNHIEEAKQYAKTFPDNRVENRPYQTMIGQGDWTCTVAKHTGTFRGPMTTEQGVVQPTGKTFSVDFCTVARWKNGAIVEEKLFYDLIGLLKQIGAR